MRFSVALAVVAATFALIACGSEDTASEPSEPTTAEAAPAPEPEPEPTAPKPATPASVCREPSGQEKFSLRFQVRAHDRELKDEPWALVRKGGVNYMAAEIDAPDNVNVPLTVLVSFPEEGKYLGGMKAINGTARTFTDLPEGGDKIPKGGEQALDCMTE